MPRGRRRQSESGEPQAPTVDLSALEVQDTDPASIQWRESTAQPSPMQGHFDASASAMHNGAKEGSPKEVTVNSEDEAKQVDQAVRRAASFRKLGSKIKHEATEDGRVRVLFAAKPRKAGRRYTPQQVREWAAQNGVEVPERGIIPADVTKLYREAHGL